MPQTRNVKRLRTLLLLLVLLGAGVSLYLYLFTDRFVASQNPEDAPRVIVGELELIAPGTVIGEDPPKGWSHLVIKTCPRVETGDVDALPALGHRLAAMLVTTAVADVQRDPTQTSTPYVLQRVGVGVGMSIDEKDVILSPKTAKPLGANLSVIGRTVLSKAYERQKDCRVATRTPTFALLDVPATIRWKGVNREMKLRYALLVDSGTGALTSLVWRIEMDEQWSYVSAGGPIQQLPPNKVEHCGLHVDKKEITLGFPSEQAFGLLGIPQGAAQFEIPSTMKALSGASVFTSAQTDKLERELRHLIRPDS